jgi:serine/threonine protein kinase/tetratricopeptide (TPR) repeat protein
MVGQTVSHYRILEELGGGGMGVVYKAEDTKLQRTVALKFLPPELTRDTDAKIRFIHEARAASALQHHNICTIHEIDETEDGQIFLAMDCYHGETLKQRIARGPLPVNEALDITGQIAAGLAKAHEAGMVHRDIKPANIIVTGDGVVKILDFGLAKLAGQTRITKTGTTVGTVAYMSPEQARGEEVDHCTDLWSLGVVLYEMLTGQLPFKGDHEAAVLYGTMNNDPDSVTTTRTDIPAEIQRLIDQLLAKSTSDRIESATFLLDRLPSSPRHGTPYTGKTNGPPRWSIRRSVAITAAIVAVAAILAFVIGQRFLSAPSADELSMAVIDFSTISDTDDRTLSASITGLVHVGLVESCPIRVISPTYLQDLRRRLFGEGRGRIEESQALEIARKAGATYLLTGQIGVLGEDRYVTWTLMDVISGRSLAARRVDETRPMDLADRIIAGVVPVVAGKTNAAAADTLRGVATITTDSPDAYRHYIAGILDADLGYDAQAIRHFEQALALDSTFAPAYLELSKIHTRESRKGRVYAEKAWSLRERLGVRDRMRLDSWLAWTDYRVKDAVEMDRALLDRWPEDREILKDLSDKLFSNWYSSVEVASKGIRLFPDDLLLRTYYVVGLTHLGRTGEALSAARYNMENAYAGYWIADIYQKQGFPDSSIAPLQQALKYDTEDYGYDSEMASIAYFKGDIDRAIDLTKELLARQGISERFRLRHTTDLLQDLSLFFLYIEKGQFEKSLEVIEDAGRDISDLERETRYISSPRNNLLLRMGRADEVLRWSREATRVKDVRFVQMKSLETRAWSLAALDSLEAAKRVVEQLRAEENFWGG